MLTFPRPQSVNLFYGYMARIFYVNIPIGMYTISVYPLRTFVEYDMRDTSLFPGLTNDLFGSIGRVAAEEILIFTICLALGRRSSDGS